MIVSECFCKELLIIISPFLFTLFALPGIYQLQIKNYYAKAVWAKLRYREGGFFIPFKMPAKNRRNLQAVLVMFLLNLATAAGIFALYRAFDLGKVSVILLFLGFWILSKLYILLLGSAVSRVTDIMYQKRFEIAKEVIKKSDARFISITGSYGKSTMKSFLIELLSTEFDIAFNPGSLNTAVAVANSIINGLKPDTEIFISEHGAYEKGTIESTVSFIKPEIGILTGLGNQHVTLFGSQEKLIEAKSELIHGVVEGGRVYVNADSDHIEKVVDIHPNTVRFSLSGKDGARVSQLGEKYLFEYGDTSFEFETPLLASHMILNLTGAIAVAVDVGVSIESIQATTPNLKPMSHRHEKREGINGSMIIDNSYNSSEDSFLASIAVLNKVDKAKKVLITKGLYELGSEQGSVYEGIVAAITPEIRVITTDKKLATMGEYDLVKDDDEMISLLSTILDEDAVILVEGKFPPKLLEAIGIDKA